MFGTEYAAKHLQVSLAGCSGSHALHGAWINFFPNLPHFYSSGAVLFKISACNGVEHL
jgi:hypothetical protein